MDNSTKIEPITLKGFFSVIKKRKLIFIITFLAVFALGLAYTFIVAPEYSSTSKLTISDNYLYHKDELYKYFPEEADDLWIIPEYSKKSEIVDYKVSKLESSYYDFKSDDILSDVIKKTGINISKSELSKLIDVNINRSLGILSIDTYYKNPQIAYIINQNLIQTYMDGKKSYLEDSYYSFLNVIDSRITELEIELDTLSAQAEESAINFASEWHSELNKLALDELEISFIDPVLAFKIKNKFEEYSFIMNIKDNMNESKELFISRTEILEKPEVHNIKNNSNYFRNILLSIAAALILGIIAAFIVNYYKTLSK